MDPVADFINQLKNASAVKKECVSVPYSKFKLAIANKLKEEGYITSVVKKGKKSRKYIEVEIAYAGAGRKYISGVTRVSKPGRRMYTPAKSVRPVKYGRGSLILSTPKGIMTDAEARKENIGGEALFKIW
jgi:small subunit ribosomal protein S8